MMTTMKLAIVSIFVSFAVLGLKSVAYWMTGSVALLSDVERSGAERQHLPRISQSAMSMPDKPSEAPEPTP